jgi:cytochrome c-type biogenesis protein CcmH/NrfG
MKKILVFLLLLTVATACQKKEEPESQSQPPAGMLYTENELKLLRDAVKNDPGNLNGWISLGNLLMDSSRFNEAVDAYQRALTIDPKNVDVRVDMGTCYRNSGKPEIAIKEFRKALEINPGHPYGHMNLGIVLAYDMKDNAQAIKEFERFLQLALNSPDANQIRMEIQRLKSIN